MQRRRRQRLPRCASSRVGGAISRPVAFALPMDEEEKSLESRRLLLQARERDSADHWAAAAGTHHYP
jgi:hypothetical protein